MAATDHLPPRRLAIPVALVLGGALVVAIVLAGLARTDSPALGDLPPTSRDDVSITVDAVRIRGAVDLSLTIEVDAARGEPLHIEDWSGGPRSTDPLGTGGSGPAEADLALAVHGDREDDGPVVLHLGLGSIVGGGSTDFMEPPESQDRVVAPGEAVEGGATFSPPMAMALPGHDPVGAAALAGAGAIRVCLWEAGSDPGSDEPAACADADL